LGRGVPDRLPSLNVWKECQTFRSLTFGEWRELAELARLVLLFQYFPYMIPVSINLFAKKGILTTE